MTTTWSSILDTQRKLAYYSEVESFVAAQRAQGKNIFPPQEEVFSAFDAVAFEQVKVVILGQDPYHGAGQAHGLSFSVKPGVKIPPSLRNIYKELHQDISGFTIPEHGYLQKWADQGVLLLNTVLTVEEGKAHSHAKCGWEQFTDAVLREINQHRQGVIFLLWGAHAQKKAAILDADRHHLLVAPHPSPLSARRGFFGCQHFSKTNKLLIKNGHIPINWQV
ncbi:uracil-DNA glycosylase [Vibrio ulleungensis]|uniref:Uracil-DNA glycosylase n=1 Tax=Vibrio ulleungensis TaxID=2807619 RepID=A0ABS2HMT9_9VIBR|nr:uracil-DNA glycosylase [Vibrio ulleungensis]MBM7037538.1 uracil-DNA glycosylase [Vibrio ulleungensis]